jgi:hypothetical protein
MSGPPAAAAGPAPRRMRLGTAYTRVGGWARPKTARRLARRGTSSMKLTAQACLILTLLLCATPGMSVATVYQDEEWKRNNDRGNRYEGLINIKTGNPELEVLSFTGMREAFGKADVSLKVKFFHHAQDRLSIIAQEIKTQRQYYMKAKQESWQTGAWNEFGPWPTRDVINREEIGSDNLGVLISDGGNRLVPALVYYSAAPATVGVYRMHLRANAHLKYATLSLYGNQGKGRPNPRKWVLAKQLANMPFYIDLVVRGYGEGPMRLVIEPHPMKEGDKLSTQEYLFYHKPEVR